MMHCLNPRLLRPVGDSKVAACLTCKEMKNVEELLLYLGNYRVESNTVFFAWGTFCSYRCLLAGYPIQGNC